MSLRIRLLIGVLVLAAAGLLVLDFVSYRALEDHLDDRANQQVSAASRPLAMALRTKAGLDRDVVPDSGSPTGDLPFVPGKGPQPPRDAMPEGLPPGTFGQLRNESGKVLATFSFDYGETDTARPDLSGDIPVTESGRPPEPVTVGAREGEGEFRVSATTGPDDLVTVAAVPLSDNQATLDRLALIQAIVTVSALAAIGGLGWWVVGIGLRPLKRMGETADEIARGDLSRRVEDVDPKTEVGRLGIALNAMLGQIEEAFRQREQSEERMRRFLADASHELRTPLASIRGYSELYRLGAITDEDELKSAMGRIESESGRMGDLVDDLLALARLDEMPVPSKEPVELGPILDETVADIRATSPGREITLEAADDLIVDGDQDQLRRAVMNVLRNAVVHTPDGCSVEVTAKRAGDVIMIAVRDHGEGFTDGAEEKVFDRFWRASESRNRDGGGAGIGLAIVAAVFDGHGGSVSAANAEGGGAIFTLNLPAATPR
jgi:two-component system, OmpR family, sensor kinase